jgi:predicted RecB family endonuclease
MSALSIRDRLLASDWQQLQGTPFENFLAQVFDALGYAVEKRGAQTSRTQGDNGIDLLISAGRRWLAVQAKGYPSGCQIGVDAVKDVYTGMNLFRYHASIVVTNSTFGYAARELARKLGCRLVDKHRVPDLIRGSVLPLYPSEVAVRCPRCQKAVSVSTRHCGAVIRCLSCAGKFAVPQITFSPEERFRQGRQLVREGDLEAGYTCVLKLHQTHPLFQFPLLYLAESLFVNGLFPRALNLYQKAIPLGACSPVVYAHAAQAACKCGEFVEARRLLGLADHHVGKSGFTAALWMASGRTAAQMRDSRAAMRYLRRAVKAGVTDPSKYESDPLLIPLRQDRGFKRLMARLRSTEGADSAC